MGNQTWNIESELVLRKDGGSRDFDYPTSVQFSDGRVLTVTGSIRKKRETSRQG